MINKLVAKVHPENIVSMKVLRKCGAREGEVLKGVYPRFVDDGVLSDEHCYYFDRPGVPIELEVKADNEDEKEPKTIIVK